MPDINLKIGFEKIMNAAFENGGCVLTAAECEEIAFAPEIQEVVSVM